MNKNNLAENLYSLRQRASLSQEEFAEKLGVSRQAVSKWERSEAYPDTENLILISKMFGVTIDELLNADINSKAEGAALNTSEAPYAKSGETANAIKDPNESTNETPNVNEPLCESFGGENKNTSSGEGYGSGGDDAHSSCKGTEVKHGFGESLPYPTIVTIGFLLIGFLFDGGWGWGWTLFITIPVYYTLIDAIKHKRVADFAYPVFCAFIYCLFGMLFSAWHPYWIIFITIPVFYIIADAIDKRNGRGGDENDDEDEEKDEDTAEG